jgi:hypothetical protein
MNRGGEGGPTGPSDAPIGPAFLFRPRCRVSATAADWPTLQEDAYLYSGTHGTGTLTKVDLNGLGTCHALSQPVRSMQIANGSASVVPYSGAGCTRSPRASGTLAQNNLSVAGLTSWISET